MTRSPLARPTLLPGLPRIWRTPHTLQLGLDPAHAVLLDLPDPRAARLLDLLDGSRPERLAVTQAGLRPSEAAALLDTLHAVGLVVPARTLFPPAMPARLTAEAAALAFTGVRQHKTDPVPARTLVHRAAARVVITGPSRLAAGVAVTLAAAGIGHVHPDLAGPVTRHELPGGPLTEADFGRPRAEAVAAAVQQVAPQTTTRPVRRGATSLVLRLGHDHPVTPPPPPSGHRHRPLLTAVIREGGVLVGPLVLPGTTPCPNCLTLHRADRDAQWPTAPPPQQQPTGLEPCGVATLLAAVAYITGEALTFLDELTPETLGAEVAVIAPGRTRRRSWPPHPSCPCATIDRR